MKIVDNVLNQSDFEDIANFATHRCDWYFAGAVGTAEDINFPYSYLVHTFYEFNLNFTHHFSGAYNLVFPLLSFLQPKSLLRVRANMYVNQINWVQHGFHEDHHDKEVKSAILYLNTNNGKTVFESGEKVDSIENRVVIFNATERHASTTCTDAWRRLVVNVLYT